MKRLIVGAVAAAAVVLAIGGTAWAAHGGDAEPAGVDIVPDNANGDVSSGAYTIDETTGARRAMVRVALADVSLTGGRYVVLLYDESGDTQPIGRQQLHGDGVNPFLEFSGPQGDGIRVDRASDTDIYACAVTYLRGQVRDLAGFDEQGACTTVAGAMELDASGISPGSSGFN